MASQSNSGTTEAANSRTTRLASFRAKSPQLALSPVVAFDIRPLRNGRTSKTNGLTYSTNALALLNTNSKNLPVPGTATLGALIRFCDSNASRSSAAWTSISTARSASTSMMPATFAPRWRCFDRLDRRQRYPHRIEDQQAGQDQEDQDGERQSGLAQQPGQVEPQEAIGHQVLGVGIEQQQEGGRAQQDRQHHQHVHHDAAQIDRDRRDHAGQAVLHQVAGIVAKVTDFRRLAALLIEPAEGELAVRRHPDRQRGADVAAAGNGREIIHSVERLFGLKALQHAEAERCGADAAARAGDAGQLQRRRGIGRGIVLLYFRRTELVMAVANGAELGPEHILEVDGLCHRPPQC